MVFCQLWTECKLFDHEWFMYLDRSHGPTTAWRFGGPHTNVMRSPDPLVFQS